MLEFLKFNHKLKLILIVVACTFAVASFGLFMHASILAIKTRGEAIALPTKNSFKENYSYVS
jgi:hypothetical protein